MTRSVDKIKIRTTDKTEFKNVTKKGTRNNNNKKIITNKVDVKRNDKIP